jgi:predicted GH43/DUF377 family glycosyl hydrolase
MFPIGALIDKGRLCVYYGAADKLIALSRFRRVVGRRKE